MGAAQSSRKITVVNDEATGKIKISDSVLQRLKGKGMGIFIIKRINRFGNNL